MTLIKPIAYFQKKKVGGVIPPAVQDNVFYLGFNFRNWNGTQLGSTTQGGIAKISKLGVLDTTWTANANPSPTTQVRFGTSCGNGKIYVDARGSSTTNAIMREIDMATGVVDRSVATNATGGQSIWRFNGVPYISDYFFISGEQTMTVQGQLVDGIGKINTSDLNRDATFATNIGTGPSAFTTGFAITPTKLGVAGNFLNWNGNSNLGRFVVLNHDGTLDSGFSRAPGLFNGNTNGVLFHDNKWIVVGLFTQYNSVTQQRIIAFNADGSLNTTFNSNVATAFNNNIQSIYRLSDTQMLVAGTFTALGEVSNRIAVINNDGTIATNRFGTGFNASPAYIAVDEVAGLLYIGGFVITSYNETTGLANAISLNIADGTINTNFVTGTGMRTATNAVAEAGNVFF
jgi:hypothetical protein